MEKDKNPDNKSPRQIKESAPINLPIEEENKNPARIVWRVLILGVVLVVLIILSIGIIKLVPRALSSLASVNVSISSLFTPSKNASSTNQNRPVVTPASTSSNQSATTSAPYPVNNGDTGGNSNSGNNGGASFNQNGNPDLQLTISSIGVLDRNSGAFVPTTNVNTNDRVAVKFQVENVGEGPSGAWNLSAALPAVNPADQTKNLSNQISIPAGMAVSGELYFDYVQTGQNRVVQISISDSRSELRTNNNSAQVTINSTGNNGEYYGGGVVTNGLDLAVQIMDTGTVDRYSGQYNPSSYINASNRAAVRFRVTNQGSIASGNWTFSATLPNSYNNNNNCYYNYGVYQCNNNNYNNGNNNLTQNEGSLAPGQSVILIVGFDGVQYGTNNTVNINVDPYNQLPDVNRGNNYASANLYVNSY
ncbi:MAG TPA: hypothetical protein VFA52_02215 [Candidatus Paceibacterota bacterium]|nr:hypothetical protein [Candidatus Paceibacterota bacterium]